MSEMQVCRLAGNIGAEVAGLSVEGVDDAMMAELKRLLGLHVVLVFPGQHLDPDAQIAFATRWGVPHQLPGTSGVATLDSTERADRRPRANAWHSDMSWARETPYVTLLQGVTIPSVGGDTIFANQCAAYDSLPEQLRTRVDGISAEHERPEGTARRRGMLRAAPGPSVHPVVRTIPETGRRALFVNPAFTRRVCGLDERAGQQLLRQLAWFATRPEVCYRHRWTTGDLVVWDNRCALHYAVADYDEPRLMRRVTVRDPALGSGATARSA